MSAVVATWSISLDCTCPACEEDVDLLTAQDFWDGRQLEVPEHGTERTRNLEVDCPKCGHEFHVQTEY